MKKIKLIFILQVVVWYSFGQEETKPIGQDKFENQYKKLKDSAQYTFTPAVSSVLLAHKQIEFNIFSALTTANQYRDTDGALMPINARQSYLYTVLQATYGTSKNGRLNVGIDLNTIIGRLDQDANSSLFKVFDPSVTGNSRYATAVSAITPRLRWRPLKNNYHFTIQTGFGISIFTPSGKQRNVIGPNPNYILGQALYNFPVTSRLFLFSQAGFQYSFSKDDAPETVYTPIAVFISYFIPKKTIPFVSLNYVSGFANDNRWAYKSYTLQVGAGVQYQFSRKWLVNNYYSTTIDGKNSVESNSYNLSIRFLYH